MSAALTAHAESYIDTARVRSVQPHYETVTVPRQQCTSQWINETHRVESHHGYGGAVVGGATGIGAAAAELARDAGAEVVVMDFAKVSLDGMMLDVVADGVFAIGFDRDQKPAAMLRVVYPDGMAEERALAAE